MVPYTTPKGVKIGLLCQQPKHRLNNDELIIQNVLLGGSVRKTFPSVLIWFAVVIVYIMATAFFYFK